MIDLEKFKKVFAEEFGDIQQKKNKCTDDHVKCKCKSRDIEVREYAGMLIGDKVCKGCGTVFPFRGF